MTMSSISKTAHVNKWVNRRTESTENTTALRKYFPQKFFNDLQSVTTEQDFFRLAEQGVRRILPAAQVGFYLWNADSGDFTPFSGTEALEPILTFQKEEGILEWCLRENRLLFVKPEQELHLGFQKFFGKTLILFPLSILGTPLGFLTVVSRRLREETIHEKTVVLQLLQASLAGVLSALRFQSRLNEMARVNGEIESQMLQSGKLIALGELVGGVAHEINNPMTTILGRIQILKMNHGLAEEMRNKLGIVEREAKRVSQIVRDLLSFSRKENDFKNNEIVSINEVIQKSLDLTHHNLEVEGIRVELDLDTKARRFVGNTNQWQQVFVNLIVNAQQAVGRGGTIFIRTRQNGGMLTITFSDDGPGIPEELKEKIFHSFFTTKIGKGGTGLGLSIVKKIVERHGGRIEVGTRDGGGAEFRIQIKTKSEEE